MKRLHIFTLTNWSRYISRNFSISIHFFIELFCLQNSLIVGMQPQVSGKVGSLVGWLVFGRTVFGIPDDCRILPKG